MSEAKHGEGPAEGPPVEHEDTDLHVVPEPELNLFVGRDELLAEAAELLRATRLVTLVGPGGVGKTRAMMHLAEQAMAGGEFVDGVVVVRLTDLREGDGLIESHILGKLQILDNSEGPGLARLIEYYSRRRALLMLDNCEHLVGEDGVGELPQMVRTLLQGTKHLKIMATSQDRRPWMRDQKILDVPPLRLEDAVQLLIARTQDVGVRTFGQPRPNPPALDRPGGPERRAQPRISRDELAVATELCQVLDRLPLAIELAAGVLDIRTPQAIVNANNKLKVLIGGASEQGRHTTMRAAIGWSYDQLKDPRERRVLQLVSIFEGGFDLEAAQAICAGRGVEVDDVEDLLSSLVRRSLLLAEPNECGMRYEMLGLIRQYGLELLASAGETAAIRDAHAAYFGDLAATAVAECFGPKEPRWMRRLGLEEEPNLRAAHERLVSNPDTLLAGMALGNNLAATRADVFAGNLNRMRRALALGLAAHPPAASPEQVTALSLSAWVAQIQGTQVIAEQVLDRAEAAARQLGLEDTMGPLLYARASRLWLADDDPRCLELFGRAGHALKNAGAPPIIQFMNDLFAAMATVFLGSAEEAFAASSRLLGAATEAQAQWCISWALWTCALYELLHGDLAKAVTLAQRALRIQLEIGDTWGPAWTRWLLALIALALGQIDLGAQIQGGATTSQQNTLSDVVGLASFWRVQQQMVDAAVRVFGDHPYRNQVAVGASMDIELIDGLALGPRMTKRRPVLAEVLTPRELEVVQRIAGDRRLKVKEIADQLQIAYRTVETHVQNVIQKLGLASRAELIDWLDDNPTTEPAQE